MCVESFLFSLLAFVYNFSVERSITCTGIVHCLPFIVSRILFFFVPCPSFVKMISFADVTRSSLNVFHFKFPVSFMQLYLLLTSPTCISLQLCSFSRLCYGSQFFAFVFFNSRNFILCLHMIGRYSLFG